MVHAFLLAGGCTLTFKGKLVGDKNSDTDNWTEGIGYSYYPGTESQDDINDVGHDFLDTAQNAIGAPSEFPKPRPPSEDPPIRVPR
jgi:hypothetical protein